MRNGDKRRAYDTIPLDADERKEIAKAIWRGQNPTDDDVEPKRVMDMFVEQAAKWSAVKGVEITPCNIRTVWQCFLRKKNRNRSAAAAIDKIVAADFPGRRAEVAIRRPSQERTVNDEVDTENIDRIAMQHRDRKYAEKFLAALDNLENTKKALAGIKRNLQTAVSLEKTERGNLSKVLTKDVTSRAFAIGASTVIVSRSGKGGVRVRVIRAE